MSELERRRWRTTFGGVLRAKRLSAGWTQKELARDAGLPEMTISHYETGRRYPSLSNIVALADSLRCSVDELLSRGGEAS